MQVVDSLNFLERLFGMLRKKGKECGGIDG